MNRRIYHFQSQTKRSSGQLAVGLAFAFVGILAMFGLVFNASLNTRDKMKIQTTSDYAALVASDVQRYNLNHIRDLNIAIEAAWATAEEALWYSYASRSPDALPYSYANPANIIGSTLGYPLTGMAPICSKDLMPVVTNAANLVTQKAYQDCTNALGEIDKKVRKQIMDQYQATRNSLASQILSTIQEANGAGFDLALDTFLAPSNLPLGLSLELQHSLGTNFTLDAVKSAYKSGNLTTDQYAYQIMDQSKDDPLFVPMNETRPFIYPQYNYTEIDNGACNEGAGEADCELNPFAPIAGVITTSSTVRVARSGNYTTQFFTGIKYTPPPNMIEKMLNVGIKNPDTTDEKFGQDVTEGNDKTKLFQRNMKSMYAMSAAKPYGGSFPVAGLISALANPMQLLNDLSSLKSMGSDGTEFTGAKLFGIADNQEIGGTDQRINRADSCIDKTDDQGNVIGCVPYYAEDFLH